MLAEQLTQTGGVFLGLTIASLLFLLGALCPEFPDTRTVRLARRGGIASAAVCFVLFVAFVLSGLLLCIWHPSGDLKQSANSFNPPTEIESGVEKGGE
jgi:hypothetical protein